jgi:hypothetical protein
MTIMPTVARMASLVHAVAGVETRVYVSGEVSTRVGCPASEDQRRDIKRTVCSHRCKVLGSTR